MSRVKLDADLIKFISLFQSLTRTDVKDCLKFEDRMVFIVGQGQISKAIGRNGDNVRRIENSLNRKIKIVEFNSEITAFVRNLIYPHRASDIKEDGKKVIITPADTRSRGRIIGRGAETLREYERITKRYFDIEEIKVV